MQLLGSVAEGQFFGRNANIQDLQSRYDITVAFASNSKPVQLVTPQHMEAPSVPLNRLPPLSQFRLYVCFSAFIADCRQFRMIRRQFSAIAMNADLLFRRDEAIPLESEVREELALACRAPC